MFSPRKCAGIREPLRSATPLVVDGAVVTAGLDGRLHIFDGVDGRVLFQLDTARPYQTINGIEGAGGSVDSHSTAAGAGMIFIGSGYGAFSQPHGNVLLGFRSLAPLAIERWHKRDRPGPHAVEARPVP